MKKFILLSALLLSSPCLAVTVDELDSKDLIYKNAEARIPETKQMLDDAIIHAQTVRAKKIVERMITDEIMLAQGKVSYFKETSLGDENDEMIKVWDDFITYLSEQLPRVKY